MSQSTEKRARRAWRNRMKATAGSDWENTVEAIKKYLTIIRWQRIAIIVLSILSAVLTGVIVWGL